MLIRRVRAIDGTQFALETFVNALILLSRSQATSVLIIVTIDVVKQRGKRRTEFETQTATMAEVVDPSEFISNVLFIKVLRMLRVVCDRHGVLNLVRKISSGFTNGVTGCSITDEAPRITHLA